MQLQKPRVTLDMYMTALLTRSSKKCCTPKDDMMCGINALMTDKILTMIRCMKMGSIGFFT
jgi:hypothetical protein